MGSIVFKSQSPHVTTTLFGYAATNFSWFFNATDNGIPESTCSCVIVVNFLQKSLSFELNFGLTNCSILSTIFRFLISTTTDGNSMISCSFLFSQQVASKS